MAKFKNKKTGVIENVTNKELAEQYTKRPEIWSEVKETKAKENKEEK